MAHSREEPAGRHVHRVWRNDETRKFTMPISLIATCALCELRFASKALLEPRLREGHPRRRPPNQRPEPPRPRNHAAKYSTHK
jgi:hypothetical protein